MGPLQLLIAQVRTGLVEAVPAVARVVLTPRNSRPVKQRLRGAVQDSCLVPVARIAGQARQVKAGAGHASAIPVPAAGPQGGLQYGPGTGQVPFRAQHPAQVRHHDRPLDSDLLPGFRGGFQVSPGGRDVPGGHGDSPGVVVQHGVDEMVAGSFGAGDRLGPQMPGPGRVDGHEIPEQAEAQLDVVAKAAGEVDRLLPERAPCLWLAGEETRGAQGGKRLAEQPLVAQLAGEPDCLFSMLPCRGDVKIHSGKRGGEQRSGEQRGVGTGVRPPEHRHQQPEGFRLPGAR